MCVEKSYADLLIYVGTTDNKKDARLYVTNKAVVINDESVWEYTFIVPSYDVFVFFELKIIKYV